jgi:hypothetical protein
MKFDINSARSAGYSDDEIADYLATQNNFDLGGALKSGYSASDVVSFLSGSEAQAPAPAAAPVTDTGDETARLAARFPAPERTASSLLPRPVDPLGIGKGKPMGAKPESGLIASVGRALKPEFKSVMEGYEPTPQERQAEIDKRLSYGAGPISQKTAAVANEVRSSRGQMASKDPTVNKVVKAMDARGEKSFADIVDSANRPEIVRAARDAKADEFRSAGEWAADTLSSLSQGAVGLVQLPINIIAPSSEIAATLNATQKELQAQESDVLKAQRQQLRERVQNEDGFFDKYAATVVQLVTSPALSLSEAVKQVPNFLGIVGAARLAGAATAGGVGLVGRASPTVALGEAISGGAIQAGARAAGTTAGGVGASMVMAGGDAAGGVYSKLTDPKQTPLSVWEQNPDYQKLTAEGKSSKDAIEEIATAKARMAALVTAPLGLLGFMGAEAAVASRGLGKATADALTFAGAGKMLAKDLGGEQLEEGGTQFGGNVISRTVDPNQKLSEGVPEAMATALVTSAPFSAVGAASQFQEARAAQTPDFAGERQAVALFDVNNYDPALIDPTQTTRGGMVGPSAPINFTPTDSPSAQAGLAPIVVPVPAQQETTDVSATSVPPLAATGSGQLAGDQSGGGLDLPGPAVNDAAGQRSGIAGATGANDAQAGAVPGAAGKPAAGLSRPFDRATDQDLLSRTEASIASQENNNAVVQPAEQWFGRKGDGYATQVDAQQALPGRQRMFPDLGWKVESMANGKFRLAGYSATQENVSGTQAPQAIQSETQGQQAPAIAGTASPAVGQPVAAGGATQAQGGGVDGVGQLAAGPVAGLQPARSLATPEGAAAAGLTAPLRLAPPAPARAVGKAITALKTSSGIDAEVDRSPLTEQQQAASAIARLSGRTVTILKADAPGVLPNGFMIPGDDKNIYIANDSDDAPLSIAMHEIYHTLPEQQRKALNAQLLQYFKADQRGDFAAQFKYDAKNDALLDEEIPAFMVQAISKREDFWQDLRTKMGNAEFAEVAKTILAKLNAIISGAKKDYGDEFVNKYITDVAKARDLLSTAYAEAMQAQGLTPDSAVTGEVMQSRRATTKSGDYDVRTMKDGTMVVYGDPEQIRAQVPEDVKGRVTKDGIVFTNAAAPRVRAALEGRQVAYSRGGEVTEKLPMKDGKYLGAPEKFNTPGKIPTLRKILRQLADEGAPGRYWYENSSREVLKMVGGDVNEARKFVALLAIYSPQAKVDANSTFALRAWAQYKAGQPISVKTGVMDTKAKNAMDDVDAFWSGEKTGNFFFNLLREIDPSTAGKQGATIDMWMMRAGQYETDAPTGTQYSFMENETNRLAQELGWEPQQVQAAIWVAMKARMENSGVKKETERTSEKKGWIKFVPGKDGKGKVRVILNEQKHRDNWLKYSFAHDVTKDDTQQAKFDFGDGLKRHIGQVSFEARPGRTTGVLPGIHSAPYAQQVEFQQAVQKAFLDDQGNDLLAMRLGLLVDNNILAPGVWQGEISPSTQLGVAMAPAKGTEGKTNVDPDQAKALNIYAAVAGLVARQEGVGWHRPFYSSTKRDSNGLDIRVGRPLNPREVADLEKAVGQWMADSGYEGWQDKFAFVSSPNGIRLVNFGIITNEKLHADILRVAESVLPDAEAQWFASSGDMMTNDWKENQNGQDYVERTRTEGRSDVLDWARAYLAPRVQRVFDDFSERYDWGNAGELRFSQRARDGGRGQGLGGTQDRQVQASERADAQAVQGLSPTDALPGAPTVQGFTGPDPRLVAVAEQYARDNGITLRRQAEYAQVDPERAARIAAAYEAMPHAPQDVRVKAAYKELIAQTLAQYRALERAGYKFWFINLDKPDNQEYASSPWNAMRDIRANKVMGVFPTDDGFGSGDFDPASNPLLEDTGIKWPSGSLFGPRKRVLANDLFRAVHDAFGHGLEGAGFRAQGEENAWQAHVRLFTGSAVAAITSETRGQNSWLNYGPNGETNRNAKVEDTVFADQKTGLLPEWAWTEGRVGDMPMFSNRAKPGFYSQLERTIANVPAKLATQPAAQWALWLDSNGPKAGVKKDEMEWSGIKDYLTLRGKDKVTSAELQAYLKGNGVKVTETMRGEVDQDETYAQMALEMFDTEYSDLSPRQTRELQQAHDRMLTQSNTSYDKYTLPGGENYRELLITLPSKNPVAGISPVQAARVLYGEEFSQLTAEQQAEVKQKIADDKSPASYMSNHWQQPNVVAHIRINDRTDADGKRVLFVEEVQSDWGQEGLKKGFSDAKANKAKPVVVFNARTGQNVARFETGAAAEAYIAEQDPGMATLDYEDTTARGGVEKGMVPIAPFVTKTEGWLNLALKRIAMLAVSEGYDKVAFVNGQQSADRYDLSKQISSISYEPGSKPENEGLLQAWDLDRKMVMSEMVTTDRIEDYVGKEVAVRLLETDKVMGKHLLDGESIKVGGKGMIKFYDEIVPQAITKLLPKLGGEKMGSVVFGGNDAGGRYVVFDEDSGERLFRTDNRKEANEYRLAYPGDAVIKEVEGDAGVGLVGEQPGFGVTDKMRETVGQGLPMFSKRAADEAESVATPEVRTSNRRQKLSTMGQNFELPATSKVDAARIKLQDDGLRMKRVIEAIKAKGGKVGEAQNFYDANTLMPGRIQAAIDDFKNNIVKPMLDQAAEYGIDMDELSMYSYAKHAKERNAYIASINKRLPDGGSGMTNDEADNILQMVELAGDTAKFEELHQALMGITSATRQIMLAEGLITQDEFTTLEGAYENYIPLRGFENVDEETGVARPGVGRGVNVRGAETVRAMGRKSKAGDLIENVIRDYERVISRVEKNDVGKVLLDFVLSNPDPDLWGVDVERSKPAFNKAQGTVQYTKSIEKGEDTIGVKVGGQQVYIKFADKELTRALRQAWKDETSGLERATLAMTGWWNDWMRAVLTKYNPAFALINIPRDALWSGTASALAELGPKGLARYFAAYPKAFMASTRQEAGASGSTNPVFGNPQVDRQFKEFRAAGGITGGFYMRSLNDINQDLRNELLLAGAAARNPWESIKSLPPFKMAKMTLRLLEFMGAASENATRFALYQASRESGRSPAQSAILAKDGTTNFNRKGEWGGALNNLYLFFNAAVQGNAQLFKVLKSPAVQASMAGVAGVGMMLALYGASAGGEDDDGEAYWDKIPSYVKERNIVIMLPPGDALAGGIERVGKRGRYVTIPVQYGFNMFPNAGYVMADVLRNAQDPKRGMTPTKAALHMTSTVLGSVNPFGGAVDVSDGVQVLLAAMPTLVDLPIQLVTERGTFGSPSAPVKSPFDIRPDSERMFTSQQDSVSAKIAKALNELGGGNEAKAGSIMGVETSVAPGTIQTLISATTGGLGSFVEQVGTSVLAMTGDNNDLKANKIPFLNKFYGEVDEGANIGKAGERMREVKKLSDEVKAQQKLGLDPELKDDQERLMRLSGMQETYQKQQTAMRKAEIAIIKDDKLTDAEKKLQRRQIQLERDKLATDMNREYLKVVPK